MNKRISDWSIINNSLHRALIALSVPMLLIILWQLYSSDKVVEVMRSNELTLAAFLYFIMIAVEIGVLAFILRVGRSDIARKITGVAVLALPFVWILFNSLYAYYEISVFGLAMPGVFAYFLSVAYSLAIIGLAYKTFALPYNINSGVEVKVSEPKEEKPEKEKEKKKVSKKKTVKKTKQQTSD